MNFFQPSHLIIIAIIALLLFGAPKLPGLARSVGQSLRIFKSEVRQMKDDDAKNETVDGTVNEKRNDEPTNS